MTAENKTVGLVKWTTWLAGMGVNSSTGWRWRKEGKITPSVNIDGHWYLKSSEIEAFMSSAEAGEFAKHLGKPKSSKNSPVTSQPNKSKRP